MCADHWDHLDLADLPPIAEAVLDIPLPDGPNGDDLVAMIARTDGAG